MADFNIDSLIPSVYIDKITLDSKAMDLKENNPHIDSEREPNTYRDYVTGKIIREGSRVDLLKKSNDSNSLIVTINFVMEEKMFGDVISSWFDLENNKNFLKYFKVKIIQSTMIDFTNQLIQAKSLLDFKSPIRYVSKDVSIGEKLLNKKTSDFYTTLRESGVREYDISFSETFVLKISNPEHLAYFSVCYLDFKTLMKDYGLDDIGDVAEKIQGKVNAELIIKNGELTSETYVFVNDRNDIWTGQVTKIEQNREIKNEDKIISVEKDVKWVAGDGKDISNPIYLQLKMIPNSKIQDFRHAKILEKELLDFSILDNSLLNQISGQLKMPNSDEIIVDINKSKAYFSDLSMARDKRGRTRFFFGVDVLSLARDFTLYGKLFHDNNLELMNYIKVRFVKIKRYRVSSNTNAFKDELGLAQFNKDDPYDLISVSGEKDTFNFVVGNLQKGTIREIVLDLEGGVRFFTGIDKDMEFVTFGLYQYVVEMEFEDKTIDFLKDRINILLNSYEILKEYYNEGIKKENYDIMMDRFVQSFIRKQENIYKDFPNDSPWIKSISSYLSVLSLLIDSFNSEKYYNSLLVFIHPRSGSPTGVSMMIKLMENLLLKLSSMMEIKRSKISSSQLSAGSRIGGGVNGIKVTVPTKTIKIEKAFDVSFDSDVPKNIGYDFLSVDEFEVDSNDDGLSVVQNVKFEERVNKETTKYFKDINSNINLKSNIKDITVDDKIVNNKYQFLTPSIIDIKSDSKINLLNKGSELFDSKPYEKIASFSVNFNSMKRSPQLPVFSNKSLNSFSRLSEHEQVVKSNLSNTLSLQGVSIISGKKANELSDLSKTSDAMGSGSLFQKSQASEQHTNGGSKSNSETVSSINPNSLFMSLVQPEISKGVSNAMAASNIVSDRNVGTIKNNINVFNLNEKNNVFGTLNIKGDTVKSLTNLSFNSKVSDVSTVVKNLPNQIKSIMVASSNPNEINYNFFGESKNILSDSKTKLGFQLNYNVINEVEVFSGYEKTIDNKSQTHMKKEMWIPLTPEKFNESFNKNLLCRMKPYNNKQFGVERPAGIELPTYNTFFILSPVPKIADNVGIVVSREAKIQDIQSKLNTSERYLNIDRKYTNSLLPSRTIEVENIQTVRGDTQLSIKTENVAFAESRSNSQSTIKGVR